MAVPHHVLNWLYSVLTSEYHDVNRTYNDVAQALAQYSSLAPRTDVHTFPSGASALLLCLSGTILVVFRGTTYRFPISIWVPHAYPREAPLVYVTPTEAMTIRPGQHVDPQGQVYHPYLAGWSTFWDKSSILDFLTILRDIFAKEPPVISRQQEGAASVVKPPTPPPLPPLPPDLTWKSTSQPVSPGLVIGSEPPSPPPKPGPAIAVEAREQDNILASAQSGPPLPPLPQDLSRPIHGHETIVTRWPDQLLVSPGPPSRYDSVPPLPPQLPAERLRPVFPPSRSLMSSDRQHLGVSTPDSLFQTFQHPLPPYDSQDISTAPNPSNHGPPPPHWKQRHSFQAFIRTRPNEKAPLVLDLMDDDLTMNTPTLSFIPAPPIPPNPEKDSLLHQLAQALCENRQRARAQNESSILGLQAQRAAMLLALEALQSDMSALTQLTALLNSNKTILQDSIRKANMVIENSAQHPAPEIDELLVAPTVVGNQLYELVAEERALADAIFVLGRAVERGRITPGVFAKMTRSLAREWYLKKALVNKIGLGMGLI